MACSISSWSGLTSMFLHRAGRGPTAQEVGLECPVERHETCVYHDILGYFGTSQVMFKIETITGMSHHKHANPNLIKVAVQQSARDLSIQEP